ncbi:hypothetical protein F5876DRAFT_82211 [Lentinula aff. lateritia]|uniref:Uncharacterized protein n=1 Tax=Lentinula aff. lateritia TaxID=2804960 RepID=A0ACC1TJX3_9AGAR|nr:hypothetical protein F5876DRAFT_82211 [Lentinula aff. lateritia]
MKAALQEAEEEAQREEEEGKVIWDRQPVVREEERTREKAAERAVAGTKQVIQLSANLERKLGIFTESATGIDDVDVTRSWRIICVLEAE